MTSSIFLPATPPLALMSATYISSVFFSGSPRKEARPVADSTAPILICACANDADSASATAAARHLIASFMFFLPWGFPEVLKQAFVGAARMRRRYDDGRSRLSCRAARDAPRNTPYLPPEGSAIVVAV